MKNECYLTDCMTFMAGLPDKAFDLAIPDPQYGIGWTGSLLTKQKTEKSRANSIKHGYKIYKIKDYDKEPPPQEYFTELFRVSKYQIIWGGNYFTDKIPPVRCWIIWNKMSEFSSVNPEMAWTNFDKPISIFSRFDGLDKGFLNKEGGHIHPNQKPVALYKWLLQNYARPGWTIFDSHVGSGSIRIACHDMGFDFTGCEIDPDIWQGQENRYQNYIADPGCFTPEEIQQLIYQEELNLSGGG